MQIRIKGYGFQLSEPYQPGTVITKAEAQALNTLRSENIQNNLRKLVDDAQAETGTGLLIPQAQLEIIQAKLSEYDLRYQFVEKKQRSRESDIQAELRVVAQERVEASLRRTGGSAEPDQFEDMVVATMALPAVIDEARSRVETRQRALAGSLADL